MKLAQGTVQRTNSADSDSSRCLKGHKQAIPEQAYYMPRKFQEVEVPRFRDSRHMKVVRLFSPTYQPPSPPLPHEIFLVLISVRGLTGQKESIII